jgi:hypothetical protein
VAGASSLKKVLAYRNADVVARFRKEYPVSQREAQQVWVETLRWLWFCGTAKPDAPPAITRPMAVIDEMWHAFVLFTRDYAAFCDKHFGRFIHHAPMGHGEIAKLHADLRANRERAADRHGKRMRAQYELIVEMLGVDTLRRWQLDYGKKYSLAALRRLRRRGLAESL